MLGEFGVEEGVDDSLNRANTGEQNVGAAIHEGKPLAPKRCHVARLRCVRSDKGGMRQAVGQKWREPDKVLAVGADPMQEDHQLASGAACTGCNSGTGEIFHHRFRSSAAFHRPETCQDRSGPPMIAPQRAHATLARPYSSLG